jgi:hypothetical protein
LTERPASGTGETPSLSAAEIEAAIEAIAGDLHSGEFGSAHRRFHTLLAQARAAALHRFAGIPIAGRVHFALEHRDYIDRRYNVEARTDARSVFFFTSSSSLSRKADGLTAEDTFPVLVARYVRRVCRGRWRIRFHGQHGNTIEHVLAEVQALESAFRTGDIAMIQTTVVDCAPRIFLEYDLACIEALSSTQAMSRLVALSHAHRSEFEGDDPDYVYVPLGRQQAALTQIASILRERNVALLVIGGIVRHPRPDEQRENLVRNIRRYNAQTAEVARELGFTLIDLNNHANPLTAQAQYFLADGQHFSRAGQSLIFRSLLRSCMAASTAPSCARTGAAHRRIGPGDHSIP